MAIEFDFKIGRPERDEKTITAHIGVVKEEEQGGVDVVLFDEDGEVELYILCINKDGTFSRYLDGNLARLHVREPDSDSGHYIVEVPINE